MAKKGTKKSPITTEQLYQQQELKYKREFIEHKFYPALKEATVSIDETTALLNAAASLIMEEAMNTLRTVKMGDIRSRLVKKLCPDHDRELSIEALLSLFDKQTLFETRGHLESMKQVISQMQMDEMRERKLVTLKEDWDRYLHG